MNPQDPLANLHPLREPAMVGWWPLAPGWWVLIAVSLLAVAALGYYLFQRYRGNAYRRLALRQLHTLHDKFSESKMDEDPWRAYVRDTNALLKSVAVTVFPRHDIAALSGEAWLQFLNKTRHDASQETEFSSSFATAAYQRDLPDLDPEQLFSASRNWIKRHRPPS